MTRNDFEKMPKVELHLHLEGAIPLEALLELVRKYGGDPSAGSLEALRKKFRYRDFSHFIDTWVWKNGFLREYDDFTWIAESVAADLVRQNVRYAEAFYSPADFSGHGLSVQKLTEAVRRGLSRVSGIEVALVADLVRDFGPEKAGITLEEVSEVRQFGVLGIGIGGREKEYPPELFESVFEKARSLGFFTSAHAGEASGPESVWNAVRLLRVDRIGHGTRAAEDPVLVKFLADSRIPLEMCPLSNIRTGIVDSIETHPIRRFFELGIPVTVSTDDPAMFGNSLAEEYRQLETHLGFSRDEIRRVILQGIRSSWMPENRKKEMLEEFLGDPAWEMP
jgi:adenosine deaminase